MSGRDLQIGQERSSLSLLTSPSVERGEDGVGSVAGNLATTVCPLTEILYSERFSKHCFPHNLRHDLPPVGWI
jgi:hypothetical protein